MFDPDAYIWKGLKNKEMARQNVKMKFLIKRNFMIFPKNAICHIADTWRSPGILKYQAILPIPSDHRHGITERLIYAGNGQLRLREKLRNISGSIACSIHYGVANIINRPTASDARI